MRAGVDLGTTLVKAAWMRDCQYQFASTADSSLEDIAKRMKRESVTDLSLAGINVTADRLKSLSDFNILPQDEQTVEAEITTQSSGVKELLKMAGSNLENYLLISIGSGTSYTTVNGNQTIHEQPGNPLGGKTIEGLGLVFGAKNYQEVVEWATRGTPADLFYKDIFPSLNGTMKGEFVIAHFGKADASTKKEDLCASAINTVAVSVVCDLLRITNKTPSNVLYIGSTVSRTPPLTAMLRAYSQGFGYQPHFPQNGEFALALGAYLRS